MKQTLSVGSHPYSQLLSRIYNSKVLPVKIAPKAKVTLLALASLHDATAYEIAS